MSEPANPPDLKSISPVLLLFSYCSPMRIYCVHGSPLVLNYTSLKQSNGLFGCIVAVKKVIVDRVL